MGLLFTAPLLLSFQDLNANGGLKPVDTVGFRNLVRPPPAPRLFLLTLSLGFCSNMDEGGVDSPPHSLCCAILNGREGRRSASKQREGRRRASRQHPGVGAFRPGPLAVLLRCVSVFLFRGKRVRRRAGAVRTVGGLPSSPAPLLVRGGGQ